ncbi:tetratricopeptide repeat protein [Bernardetia sp.]|uniref:tetratricopeptide repeat protein n=1 Tax=Bernardetia sp. TaxID=1937974 RepID=UPI0025BE18EA|nr:tetratricopeptide repeat protein [Bernardetia sp.]
MHFKKNNIYTVLLFLLFSYSFSSNLIASQADSLASVYKGIDKKEKIEWLKNFVKSDISAEEKIRFLNMALLEDKASHILKAKIYAALGFLKDNEGNSIEAIEAYENALSIQKNANEIALDTLADNWKTSLATIFHYIGDYQKAYTIYMEVLQNVEKQGKKETLASINKMVGDVHRNLENEEEAIRYYNSALEIYKELGIKRGEASTSNSLGILYSDQNQPQKALKFYRKTLQLCKEIDFETGIALTLNNIGYELFILSNYDSAYHYYEEALHLKEKLQNTYSMSATLVNMGQVRLKQKEYVEAKLLFEKSLELAIETKNKSVELENYQYLSELYQKINKTAEALEMLQKYIKLKEVIFEENKLEKINELEARFQAGKKEQQIGFLKQKAEWEEGKSYLLGGVAFLAIIVIILAFRRIRGKQQANQLLSEKNKEITKANRKVTESITYAKHIQDAVQVNETSIFNIFPNYFIFNRPKDIVGGDCLWFAQKENTFYLALADCTGHGVAGAFMTILCNSLLNDIFNHHNSSNGKLAPAEILEKLDNLLQKSLHQKQTQIKDGMDMAIIQIKTNEKELVYAGAKIPLYYKLPNQELHCIKATRRPIGEHQFRNRRKNFENITLEIQKGLKIFISSDGLQDQFGGKENKKFMRKNFEKLIANDIPLSDQEIEIIEKLENWKGDQPQTDDIMVVGLEF